MDRRTFLAGTGAVFLATPLAAEAQQAAKVYRIGFLSYLGCGASLDAKGAFRQGLREIGYVEGQNLAIECRDARGRVDRFPNLAGELGRLNVDVLVAESTPSALAAKQATTLIPIVMVGVADPVASKLVASLAGPGGNVKGPMLYPTLEVVVKVLELLKETVPSVSRVAVLRDPTNSSHLLID